MLHQITHNPASVIGVVIGYYNKVHNANTMGKSSAFYRQRYMFSSNSDLSPEFDHFPTLFQFRKITSPITYHDPDDHSVHNSSWTSGWISNPELRPPGDNHRVLNGADPTSGMPVLICYYRSYCLSRACFCGQISSCFLGHHQSMFFHASNLKLPCGRPQSSQGKLPLLSISF